jgi:mono/diheme cytochrome c family protein
VGVAALGLGCSSGAPLSEAAQRGRSTYMSVCIACHNQDPALDGAIGPAIAGASRELIEARVVHAGYPPGYQPKRSSTAMPAFPQLAGQVDDLHAFLSECCKAR